MADGAGNQKPSVGDTSGEGGLPFYEAQRKSLQKLMDKKRKLAERLVSPTYLHNMALSRGCCRPFSSSSARSNHVLLNPQAQREERIEQKETEYLESTPAGNILTGFDNYTKGTTQAAAAQRRKTGPLEQHRVFSRSSISYNPNNSASDSATTPGSSHAPTPISTTFGGSNHPTPTSAGGPNRPSGTQRDRKKKAVAASADAGDSESDAKEVKKVRTNFGASRK